jgi:NNP family nitrate/nitrite transporter-like MFS transporter
MLILPTKDIWQVPSVKTGEKVKKKQVLAKGFSRIYFQANLWIFASLVFIIGIVWGIGKAAVYRFIPDYFPDEVGVVGGMVGVIGGLGGFVCPIVFGYLLDFTGLWTSSWMFMLLISIVCFAWMFRIVQKIRMNKA